MAIAAHCPSIASQRRSLLARRDFIARRLLVRNGPAFFSGSALASGRLKKLVSFNGQTCSSIKNVNSCLFSILFFGFCSFAFASLQYYVFGCIAIASNGKPLHCTLAPRSRT